ncbi:hypothetical protein [Stygiobacter electus]|uniref:Uncharacterized protein n=1 Tax=Stygiobacter electus TaxID=3032292 RepID=A0AAE3P2E4_9BACT|nr:hypothetical protein [Stygiobacter electus]MDF1613129.1 hypothetical protein [Stygiobacter electus]
MIKKIIHRTTKTVSAFILVAIVFSFLHSEVGLLDYDDSNHGAHDYCEIVKLATTKIAKDVSKDSFKLTVDKSICFHCINEGNQHTKTFTVLNSEQLHSPQKTTEVYLFNRTFLI